MLRTKIHESAIESLSSLIQLFQNVFNLLASRFVLSTYFTFDVATFVMNTNCHENTGKITKYWPIKIKSPLS